MKKRSFVRLALCSVLGVAAMQADAAGFPEKPIKLGTPFPPGGVVSTIAYTVARRTVSTTLVFWRGKIHLLWRLGAGALLGAFGWV